MCSDPDCGKLFSVSQEHLLERQTDEIPQGIPLCRGKNGRQMKGADQDMSQAKVDQYKKEKANRKQIMRKQKMMNLARKAVLSLAGLALVGWLGYSAWDMYESGKERVVAEVNYDAVTDYLSSLTEDTADAE